MKNDELRKNGSGYSDPTAYKAIKNVSADDEFEKDVEWWDSKARMDACLKTVKYIIKLAGFELDERIVLRDKKTGKVWR